MQSRPPGSTRAAITRKSWPSENTAKKRSRGEQERRKAMERRKQWNQDKASGDSAAPASVPKTPAPRRPSTPQQTPQALAPSALASVVDSQADGGPCGTHAWRPRQQAGSEP